jgi:hypothetical protein
LSKGTAVREKVLKKAVLMFRTPTFCSKELQSNILGEYDDSNFVRNRIFSLLNMIARTIVKSNLQPRATPGFTGIALG